MFDTAVNNRFDLPQTSLDLLRRGRANTDANDVRVTLARRLTVAGQMAESRTVLPEAVFKNPANSSAVALLKQVEGQ